MAPTKTFLFWARKLAELINCQPYKEGLSTVSESTMSLAWKHTLVIPVLGRWRQAGPWGSASN